MELVERDHSVQTHGGKEEFILKDAETGETGPLGQPGEHRPVVSVIV